jgi:type IV pilus assembly protein PilM
MLSSKKKEAVGIDIGSSSVKLVELKETKKGYQLKNFGVAPLPSEAIVDGVIMDSGAIADAIRNLVTNLKVKVKDVVTSVSGHSVIIKKINLPVMTDDELAESIQWEAEQFIPFDINDVNIDFQIMTGADSEDQGQMEVLLVAVKKDMINDYVTLLNQVGLNPVVVDVDSFAIENMFEVNYQIEEGEVTALINIGASIMNINILKSGVPAFTRDISMGGNQYTEEIQKRFSVSYEDAEMLKLGGDLPGVDSTEVGEIMKGVSDSVATEIQRSLNFFAATSITDQISKVYLCGGGSKVKGFIDILEDKVGLPVEFLNPFQNIYVNERYFDPDYIIKEIAPLAAVGVGLALRRARDK